MKKNRNLAVAVFLGALVIFGIQSQAAAQENLGQGSWDLIKIETTATGFGVARRTKELPVETRERPGIFWGYGNRRITADLVFKDLKETVVTKGDPAVKWSAGHSDISLGVLVKAAVTGEHPYSNDNTDFVTMKCAFDLKSSSGYEMKDPPGFGHRIYARSYLPGGDYPRWFLKKGEFECVAFGFPWLKVEPEEDFTFSFRLLVSNCCDAFPEDNVIDATFHFFYKWMGWRKAADTPATSGSTNSPGDAGVGPLDRDGQYSWAQKQDASALESRLISNAARLFGSPSVASEKLSSAFADVSVIIADRASKANFSSDDKDAASTNWSTHKNWAAQQGPKVSLDNLQQRLSAAFKYLSRSLQDLFFADVSVAMAKAEVAEPANQAAAQGSTSGLTIKTKKPVFAPNERIEVEYAYSAANERDWIALAHRGGPPQDRGLEDRWVYVGNEPSGTRTINGVPEGPYDALYIKWEGGNNREIARVPFTVGTAPPPPPTAGPPPPSTPPATPPPTSGPPPPSTPPSTSGTTPPSTSGPPPTTGQPPATVSSDLSGFWVDDTGGGAVYRVRQLGNKVYWSMDATAKGEYVNVFHGVITGNMIDGEWLDMPGSPLRPALVAATLGLRIESNDRLVKVRSGNHYPAQVWTRQPSPSGLPTSAGTACAPGNPEKTVTIEVPANRAWTPTGVSLNSCTQVMVQASGAIQAAASGGPQGFYNAVPPGGRAQFHPDKPQQLLPALSMLGRIGDGPVVSIGPFARWYAGGPYGSGELFLGINDDGVDDNSGVWQVRITTFGAPAQPPATSGGGGRSSGTSCESIQGTWTWSSGGTVTFLDSGKVITSDGREGNWYKGIFRGEINYTAAIGGTSYAMGVAENGQRLRGFGVGRGPGRNTEVSATRDCRAGTARSSGGVGQVQKVLPVGAQPTGNKEVPKVEPIPPEVVATSKPPTRSRSADTTAARTRNRTEPPQVEPIPPEVVATSKPPTRSRSADTTAARTRNRTEPPQVEPIPPEVVATSKPPTRSRSADTTAARTRNRTEPPQVEPIPPEVVATSKPPRRSRPADTTAARTRNRTEPPQVEPIPPEVVATSKPPRRSRPADTTAARTRNRTEPPQVEPIPPEVVATSKPPRRSRPADTTAARTRNRTQQPQVEAIPKVAVKPNRPTARRERPGATNTPSTGGGNQPTTQRQPPTQRQPAGGVWTLVSTTVSPETPAQGAVKWEYTAQGSSAHYTLYNGDKANFQWTPPPQQIDSNGFTVFLSVEGIPGPNSPTIAAYMNVSGPQGLTSDTPADQQSAYVKAENRRDNAQKSVAFTPTPNASELEVRITLFGSVTYTYKYRRAQ